MKHILVTGGNGFIGKYVVEELQGRGFEVVTLDRKADRDNPADGRYFGDIKDPTLVTEAVAHVDGVIHLAGVLGTQETIANPVPAAETNILGGLNVINACTQYDVPLINIAVGNWWMTNTYSITKNTVERFVEMKRKYENKAMGSVRALNAYGPRQVPTAPYGPSRVRKIMPSFICRALSGEPIEVYGDGQQIMDMIHVKDVAYILVSALEHLDAAGVIPVIEAGTGRDTTVAEIAEIVSKTVVKQAHISTIVNHLPMRPGEDPNSVVKANTDTLAVLGIKAKQLTTLEQGVPETVAYYREYLGDR